MAPPSRRGTLWRTSFPGTPVACRPIASRPRPRRVRNDVIRPGRDDNRALGAAPPACATRTRSGGRLGTTSSSSSSPSSSTLALPLFRSIAAASHCPLTKPSAASRRASRRRHGLQGRAAQLYRQRLCQVLCRRRAGRHVDARGRHAHRRRQDAHPGRRRHEGPQHGPGRPQHRRQGGRLGPAHRLRPHGRRLPRPGRRQVRRLRVLQEKVHWPAGRARRGRPAPHRRLPDGQRVGRVLRRHPALPARGHAHPPRLPARLRLGPDVGLHAHGPRGGLPRLLLGLRAPPLQAGALCRRPVLRPRGRQRAHLPLHGPRAQGPPVPPRVHRRRAHLGPRRGRRRRRPLPPGRHPAVRHQQGRRQPQRVGRLPHVAAGPRVRPQAPAADGAGPASRHDLRPGLGPVRHLRPVQGPNGSPAGHRDSQGGVIVAGGKRRSGRVGVGDDDVLAGSSADWVAE